MWDRYLRQSGGILADEMGLGKTIQVICLLLAIYRKTGTHRDKDAVKMLKRRLTREFHSAESETAIYKVSPSIVIAPACLVDNWANEIAEWGHFSVLRPQKESPEATKEALAAGYIEIVLLSYEFLQSCLHDFKGINFDLIVFDEGHRMSNTKTQAFAAALSLKPGTCRLILTGTPIQNKIQEIGSLLSVIKCGKFLSGKEFKEHFDTPIKRGAKRNACDAAIALKNARQKELDELLKKYMLRRLKNNELKMKGKSETVIYCELSVLQKTLYKRILSLPDFDNARYNAVPCKTSLRYSSLPSHSDKSFLLDRSLW
jgi:SNF2 family DNA or RNA helicase